MAAVTSKNILAAGLIAAAALFSIQTPAHATPFSGTFDPSNWTFDADGGDGSVNTSGAPSSIFLAGNNNGVGVGSPDPGIITSFSITISANTTFTFDWNYDGTEDSPFWDRFGYFVNSTFFELTDRNGPDLQSGSQSVSLGIADIFGFYIDSGDGCCGRGYATITGGEDVPVPGALFLVGLGLLGLGAVRRTV